MKYVYIDESGETGKASRYILFASLSTEQFRVVDKAMRKIWRVKPALHSHGELHAYKADDATRRRVLQTINDLNVGIDYLVIDKLKQTESLDEVYYKELARLVSYHGDAHFIIVDQKDTIKKRNKVIEKLGLQDIFARVSFERSHEVRGLQAVDFVAWAIRRRIEFDDDEFSSLLDNTNSL